MTKASTPAAPIRASERDSREKLVKAAKNLFARKGYDGTTVKELADEAGVNVSLVSYYFGGKEGLYRTCLHEAGLNRLQMAEKILVGPTSLEDMKVRLRLYLEDIFNFHLEETEVTAILQRECGFDNPISRDVFSKTFLKVYDQLVQFFARAQKAGILRQNCDTVTISTLFFGGVTSVLRFEEIGREYYGLSLSDPEYRERIVQHAINGLIEGFVASGNRS